MLSKSRKYLVQLVRAADGVRSEPFIITIDGFIEMSTDMTDEEKEGSYVLVLADIGVEMPVQDFVSRFPLYRISTFVSLDFTKFTSSVDPITSHNRNEVFAND